MVSRTLLADQHFSGDSISGQKPLFVWNAVRVLCWLQIFGLVELCLVDACRIRTPGRLRECPRWALMSRSKVGPGSNPGWAQGQIQGGSRVRYRVGPGSDPGWAQGQIQGGPRVKSRVGPGLDPGWAQGQIQGGPRVRSRVGPGSDPGWAQEGTQGAWAQR